jgi:glutamate-1-semialdehyde aminotransferase
MYKHFHPFKKGLKIIKKSHSSPLSEFLKLTASQDCFSFPVPVIKRGKGPFLYDYDENRFVDYFLSAGSLLLGHAHPGITKTIKTWLSRGYAPGYQVASHELLSKNLFNILIKDSLRSYEDCFWLYYDSSQQAFLSIFSLLEKGGYKRPGVCLSGCNENDAIQNFYKGLIKTIRFDAVDMAQLTDFDYVIIRIDGSVKKNNIIRLIKNLHDRGIIIISDETGFESYVHTFQNRELQECIDVRIFGNWISSGLPFGCICAGREFFHFNVKTGVYSLLFNMTPFLGLPPLYKIKAAIESTRILQKKGGLDGAFEKHNVFFYHLYKEYFKMVDNILYLKIKTEKYNVLHQSLLEKSILFPFRQSSPLFLSFSHTSELLKRSADRINSVFEIFFR